VQIGGTRYADVTFNGSFTMRDKDLNMSDDFSTSALQERPLSQTNFGDGVGDTLSKGTDTVREKATDLRTQATDKLRSFADEGKNQVSNSLDGLVTAAREIADKLQGGAYGPLAGYATTAADRLEDWTRTVRDKSVEELIDEGRELVRRAPTAAIGVAVAAGFVLSRFAKASGGRYQG
jgi:ElaB/YqjD/DUF883 family membrane-anchored ribosome-binding protein